MAVVIPRRSFVQVQIVISDECAAYAAMHRFSYFGEVGLAVYLDDVLVGFELLHITSLQHSRQYQEIIVQVNQWLAKLYEQGTFAA